MPRFASSLVAAFLLPAAAAFAVDPAVFAPNENLLVDGVPPVPAEIAQKAEPYGNFRGATLFDVNPNGSILVATRFADTNQVHMVGGAGAARQQLTFFPDRVEGAVFVPPRNENLILHKGAGGAEFYQNYLFNQISGEITLLTDGKSRNSAPVLSYDGKRLAYTSTRRDGTDTDLYVEDPLVPKSDRLLAQVQGGGWEVQDWSTDGKRLLVLEEISIAESYLWLVDAQTGEKTALTPRTSSGEKVAYHKARFVRGNPAGQIERGHEWKGIWVLTDQGSEYQRLALLDPDTGKLSAVSEETPYDVEDFSVSGEGNLLAYTTNEAGRSVLRVIGLKTSDLGTILVRRPGVGMEASATIINTPLPVLPEVVLRLVPQGQPAGMFSGLRWEPPAPLGNDSTAPSQGVYFNVSSAQVPSDVYRYQFATRDQNWLMQYPQRYTYSETGGLPGYGFVPEKLVKWKSFDGLEISGFLYAPDEKKFPGKRPVIVNIHGGPEAQYRPGFLGRNNYLVNELGCALIFPNVRGSAGYGKTFVSLDNGLKREDSYKDIDALLDWIKTQPGLDGERIMVTGGSYGGHMTLAVSTFYADKIRCSVDVVGMSNLRTFLEHTEGYRRDLRRVEYGDERDPQVREFMDRVAPMNNAQKIAKPMFVVQGYNDPRVPRTEAEQIVATLKAQGTPVWFLMAKDEGHGFAKKKNADYQFYATVEFIRRYLLDGK